MSSIHTATSQSPDLTEAKASPSGLDNSLISTAQLPSLKITSETTLPYNRDFIRDALQKFINSNYTAGLLLKDFLQEHSINTRGTGTNIIKDLSTSGCLHGPLSPFGIAIGFIPSYAFIQACAKDVSLANQFRISQINCQKTLEYYNGSPDFFEVQFIQRVSELFRNKPLNHQISSQDIAKKLLLTQEEGATLIRALSDINLLVNLGEASQIPEVEEIIETRDSEVNPKAGTPLTYISAIRTNELSQHVLDLELKNALDNPVKINPLPANKSSGTTFSQSTTISTGSSATKQIKSLEIQAAILEIIIQNKAPISAADILAKLPANTISSAQMVKYHARQMIKNQTIRSETTKSGYKTELFSINA